MDLHTEPAEEKYRQHGAEVCVVIPTDCKPSTLDVLIAAGERAIIPDDDDAPEDLYLVHFEGRE